ncbi:MAG: Rpn family recombination-promoting nuclease/putative transposase [Treponema sp.]|nr:Rpn family recombination-promoting nuclease/putative transposase [Treponema sp.]
MKNDSDFPRGKPKPFEELTFHDDFMFGIVMQDREICREALECMLGMKIARVDYAEPQRTLDPLYTAHGIRLDVYVQDSDRVYDVEIQNRDLHDLGRRTRFYQSVLDTDALLKGEDYGGLKESIIIFLCRFDPYKKGIPCYTIRRKCEEDGSVAVGDAATVHVLNCREYAKVKDPNLRAFMKYVQTDEAESDFTRRLRKMVEVQKSIEGAKKFYLSWSLHDYDVRNEGREEKARETARNMLARNYPVNDIAEITGLSLADVEQLAARQ